MPRTQITKLAKGSVKTAMRIIERRPRRNPAGAPPGTLFIHPDARAPSIRFMGVKNDEFHEVVLDDLESLRELMEAWPVHWIDIDGLGSEAVIREIGEIFEIHPLALEDVAHNHQRAKMEDYERYIYYVAKMVSPTEDAAQFRMEQVSIFIFKKSLVTFQEQPGDCLEAVRQRIRQGRGRIRKGKADFFGYAVIDAMIDGYFPFLEHLGDALEECEAEILVRPSKEVMERVHVIRRQLFTLRRALWPQREAVNALLRPSEVISKDTQVYLRDCYDHTVQLVDLTENYRELSAASMDLYLSGLSQRLNEVMKFLAIISTIFLPLTFIAGIYGMNFTDSPYNMPELTWTFGYFMALALMAAVAAGLILAFRRLSWL